MNNLDSKKAEIVAKAESLLNRSLTDFEKTLVEWAVGETQ